MKTIKNWLVALVVVLGTTFAFGQQNISGTVVDNMNTALPGASVKVGTTGTATDFDGNFAIEVPAGVTEITVSYVGFSPKVINIAGKSKLGTIALALDNEIDEVVLVGVADIAKDRQTPVAVSTLKAAEITEKLGTQEFPEVLKTTPGIYATKNGGGFGDSRVSVRGFDSRNVAVLINGMPVNDMENGKVYWSNWAGLSDVTSAMQVQRGLGSSKMVISSVGGTINVLTSSADKKRGGAYKATIGNDGYFKNMLSYNTGLLDNGFSASFLFSRTAGDGYIDGTKFLGKNYYLAVGYKAGENSKFQLTVTGAPQWHHQNYRQVSIKDNMRYNGGDINRKYNQQWGYLRGEEFSWRKNFYHKPIASLNWNLKLSESAKIATVVYASWGRGGGTGPIGKINGGKDYYSQFRDNATGLVRFDDIYAWNSGRRVPDFGADRVADMNGDYINDRSHGFTRRASMNSHDWYGVISDFNKKLGENLTLDFGVDLRMYNGHHYRVVNNDLGADAYFDNKDINNANNVIMTEDYITAEPAWNPFSDIKKEQKIEYYNDGKVNWLGAFGQVEYKKDKVSAFLQFAASSKGYQRIDYFQILDSDATQATDVQTFIGGNLKGGMNFNIDDNNNVFFNAGYYSKQPGFDNIFLQYSNTLNPDAKNETVIGLEVGYGYKSEFFNAHINAYRTTWDNREIYGSFTRFNGTFSQTVVAKNVNEIHQGVELDFTAKASDRLKFNGMVSFGDFHYSNDEVDVEFYDDNVQLQGTATAYLKDVKVGDVAQFTTNLGLDYKFLDNKAKFFANWYHADKLYSDVSFSDFDAPGRQALQLPSYDLLNTGVSYKFDLNEKNKFTVRLNVNNVFDTLYIAESDTNKAQDIDPANNWNGVNKRNRVYWGFGRTWSMSFKLNF